MTAPVDLMLDQVEWTATGQTGGDSNLAYATHQGVLEIFGGSLRCYRLNTGEAVFDADDFQRMFADLLDEGEAA